MTLEFRPKRSEFRVRYITCMAALCTLTLLTSCFVGPAPVAETSLGQQNVQRTVSFSDCRSWYHETYPLLFPHFKGKEEVHDPNWCQAFHKTLMQSDEQRPDFFNELLDDPADYCQRLRLKYKDKLLKLGRPKRSENAPEARTCEESTAATQAIFARCSEDATSMFDENFAACLEREAVQTHAFEFLDLQNLRYSHDLWKVELDRLLSWSKEIEFSLDCSRAVGTGSEAPKCH